MRSTSAKLIWAIRRYQGDGEGWDRICGRCKQQLPVFEYEHRDEQDRSLFGYLCEDCAQKKLAEWLQCVDSPDYVTIDYLTAFDIASVIYEPKNDAETLTLTRWSSEQRRRRLQGET